MGENEGGTPPVRPDKQEIPENPAFSGDITSASAYRQRQREQYHPMVLAAMEQDWDRQGRETIGAPKPLFSAEEIKYIRENGEMPAETKAKVRQESDLRANKARYDYRSMVREEVAQAAFPKLFTDELFGITDNIEQYMYDTNRINDVNYRGAKESQSDISKDLSNVYSKNHLERGTKLFEDMSNNPGLENPVVDFPQQPENPIQEPAEPLENKLPDPPTPQNT